MEREIKFRVWDIDNKRWVKHLTLCVDLFMPKSWFRVMQFTGLLDKNGNEIYEGDVLEFKNDLGKHIKHQVFYKEGGLCVNTHNDDFHKPSNEIVFYEACADMQNSGWLKQCETIGNIYENPELLKKEQILN